MPQFINKLSGRLGKREILGIAEYVSQSQEKLEWLYDLTYSDERRLAVNALWSFTHLPETSRIFLENKRDCFIDRLLQETDSSKKRIFLQILRDLPWTEENSRADFLDFCFSKINSECEPYAVRCFSIYCAFKICRCYPELLHELEEHLEMLSTQALSPGLRSGLRQTHLAISKLRYPQSG